MSLLYSRRKRQNPQDRTAPEKYYLEAKPRGFIDLEALLDAACDGNTADRDEIRLSINRMFKKAEEYLSLGFNVHLGELGYMELTIRSRGASVETDATPLMATDIVPHFIFGEKMRDRLKKTKLEHAPE